MILLSAGHSNADPGAVNGKFTEAEIVRDFRNIVAKKLQGIGAQVKTDGEAMENLPLAQAIKMIAGTKLAIEFHCNASTNSAARGVESISLPDKKDAARAISVAVESVMHNKLRGDGGWIDQSLSARGKLGFVQAGGIIVELFFLSNTQELIVFQAKKWLIAEAVAQAIFKEANK